MESSNKSIYSTTLSERFFESALQYNEAIYLLENSDFYYPKVFLQRHTLELLLKAYILYKVPKVKIIFSDKKVFSISYDTQLIRLNSHKLCDLFNSAFLVDDKLIKDFPNSSSLIKEVKKWDKYDPENVRYKYPISLEGVLSKRNSNPVFSLVDEVMPETRPNSRSYFILEGANTKSVINIEKIDSKLMEYSGFLNIQIKKLLVILNKTI